MLFYLSFFQSWWFECSQETIFLQFLDLSYGSVLTNVMNSCIYLNIQYLISNTSILQIKKQFDCELTPTSSIHLMTPNNNFMYNMSQS